MLERSVLFIRVGSWLAGITHVIVVVLATSDATFVVSVKLAVYAPEVSFEIVAGSMSQLRLTTLIGLAVETADSASNEKSPRENI